MAEIEMRAAEDAAILSFAAARHLVVVTLDADFHSLLAASGANLPSVIRLRLQGVNAEVAVMVVETAIAKFSAELAAGSVLTVKQKKTTCHRLPIGGSAE